MKSHIRELSDDEKIEKLLAEAELLLAAGNRVSYAELVCRYGLAGRVNHVELAVMHSERRQGE